MSHSKHISLSELQLLIKKGIVEAHPMPYWVVAEIGELKVNYSGHCYLELVEKGGANSIPRAKVNAVIWRSQYSMIASYFRTATDSDLQAGIKVLIKVVVNYHELYGMSFQITDIEPSYTLGDIEAQRRETIERLRKEGVYEMNRRTELPGVLQRLAVISSKNAAGYQDFMNELNHNLMGYAYRVTLFAAVMQGNETEATVIDALDRVAEQREAFDAVILIRGGGSQSDLGAFNSYRLCSHLAQFPLPLLTGIGHDKDQSVADLVAHTALKTPTAVAVFLTDHNAVFEQELDERMAALADFAQENLHNQRLRLSEFGYALKQVTADFIHTIYRRLDELQGAVDHRAKLYLEEQRGYCHLLAANLSHAPLRKLLSHRQELAGLESRIADLSRFFLSNRANKLALLEAMLSARNPEQILKMGYAIVRSAEGRAVKSVADVGVGTTIHLQLSDGTAEASVTRTTKS